MTLDPALQLREGSGFFFFSVINFEADFSTLSHHDLGVWG